MDMLDLENIANDSLLIVLLFEYMAGAHDVATFLHGFVLAVRTRVDEEHNEQGHEVVISALVEAMKFDEFCYQREQQRVN